MLFVFKTISCAFVLQKKSFTPTVFPERVQTFPASAAGLTAVFTNAVVAIWVVFVPAIAVGDVGVPVSAGDARSALFKVRSSSCHWTLLVVLSRYPSSVVDIVDEASIFPLGSEISARFTIIFPVRYSEIAPESADQTLALLK